MVPTKGHNQVNLINYSKKKGVKLHGFFLAVLRRVYKSILLNMKMTRSEVMYLLLGVLCIIQITNAAPISDIRDGNSIVDEIIMKLKQLRQQNEGKMSKMTI